jgi:hypothetical protein
MCCRSGWKCEHDRFVFHDCGAEMPRRTMGISRRVCQVDTADADGPHDQELHSWLVLKEKPSPNSAKD